MEGIDNWFYARVRNCGSSSAQHFMVTFTVKPWAGAEFVYPADFIPCTAATGGFELAPDEEKMVSVKWPAVRVPPAGTHACLLASVIARRDHPSAGDHVWQDNKRAQRNLTIMKLMAGRPIPFRLYSKSGFPLLIGLRLQVPRNVKKGSILLSHLFERRRKRIGGGISVQINVGGA